MTRTSLPQVQVAIVTTLRAAAAFTALVTGVYDAVPETPAYSYAVIDDPFEVPDRTFGQDGHSVTLVLSIYTRDGSTSLAGVGSAGFRTGELIAAAAIDALVGAWEAGTFAVDGHDVVDVDTQSIEAFREADGVTRRVDITLSVLLEDSIP